MKDIFINNELSHTEPIGVTIVMNKVPYIIVKEEEELIADAIGLNMTLEEIDKVIEENDK